MTHKPLKAGDIRQDGDEVKRNVQSRSTDHDNYGNTWSPVRLLGHVILPSDLIVSTFRRPVNE